VLDLLVVVEPLYGVSVRLSCEEVVSEPSDDVDRELELAADPPTPL
jgi:hypothetical protein